MSDNNTNSGCFSTLLCIVTWSIIALFTMATIDERLDVVEERLGITAKCEKEDEDNWFFYPLRLFEANVSENVGCDR